MPLQKTDSNRKVFKKASALMLVPYVYDSDVADYVLGSVVYDLSAIIGDSIVLEQGEGESSVKYNEFTNSPLVSNVTAGKYAFTAQCLDLQNAVMKAIFVAMTGFSGNNEVQGAVALQDDNPVQYAMLRISFRGDSLSDIYLPKVQLNSKLMLQQMHSRGSQGNLNGTALSRQMAIEDGDIEGQLLKFVVPGTNEETYIPFTPVLFCPKGKTPLFLHHEDTRRANTYVFSSVNFTTGTVGHNVVVDSESGEFTISS